MIWESLLYLVTPCPRFVRAMGYPQEQIAISSRAKRCAKACAPHMAASKSLVLDAAKAAPGRRRAVLIGSGLLFELPVAELADQFEEVICVDLVHPPWIVRPWREKAPNVRFLAGDATGMLERFVSAVQTARSTGVIPALPESRPRLALEPDRCDLIVSANVMTQLPVSPIKYLQNRLDRDAFDVEGLDGFADQIMRAHLDWLKETFSAPVCLFADDWRETRDASGAVVERVRAFPEAWAFPEADVEWAWDIAPKGEAPDGEAQIRWVKGWRDLFGALS